MKAFYFLIFFSLNSCAHNGLQSKSMCSGENKTLSCLELNFSKLYKQDYSLFFNILNDSMATAVSCNDYKNTSAFLNISTKIEGNSEVSEFFSDVIENKFLRGKVDCFLKALSHLDKAAQDDIVNRLSSPLYISKKDLKEEMKPFILKYEYSDLAYRIFKSVD